MAMSMKTTVLWDVVPCSLVEDYQYRIMEAASISEISGNYQTVWHNIPDDSHL
jgi:hypothetical protein